MSDHVSPICLYVTIFLALMVLTALTVGAAFVNLGQFNFPVAMIIAVFKASLVVWYFMHVKYQSRLTKLTVATGLFFLTILLGMMLIDYGVEATSPPMPPPIDADSVIALRRTDADHRAQGEHAAVTSSRAILLSRAIARALTLTFFAIRVGAVHHVLDLDRLTVLAASADASALALPFITCGLCR